MGNKDLPATGPLKIQESSKSLKPALRTHKHFKNSKRAAQKQHQEKSKRHLPFIELPAEILAKILEYLTFKEISMVRLVSHRVHQLCAAQLNSTFQKFQKYVTNQLQSIEHRMPRKKSARRSHPLGPEYRVIEYLEIKISLLQITFGVYIETGQICFYPGEILDEISRSLRSIASTKTFDFDLILEDLITLIDMAVEHF